MDQITRARQIPGVGGMAILALVISCEDAAVPAEPAPPPSLYSLEPQSVTAGSAAFTLTVRGAHFTTASRVRWAGADRPTTLVSDSVLTAAIAPASVANVGTVAVTVYTGPPGGGTSPC